MSRVSIRWAGTRALLVELASLDTVLAYHSALRAEPSPGQIDVLAAATTVLIKYDSRRSARQAHERVRRMKPAAVDSTQGKTVEIPVIYDGDDLEAVGALTGLGAAGVIEAHTGQIWRGAFGGFAPGFTYLVGENDALEVPRRDSPRTAVPAGSVALAGHFSAIYPGQSPGGWQLIGRTDARLWDIEREQPALVRPGDRVRYVAVEQLGEQRASLSASGVNATPDSAPRALEIMAPGLQSLIQDLGRPGLGDLGVSAAGAADVSAARQANRLVGNPPTDAVIETVMGGLKLRARTDIVLALSGARSPASIDGDHGRRPAPLHAPFRLRDSETLELAKPTSGLRSYLAVRGGIDVPSVLGSRSTDSMSGIGPAPLESGQVLAVGEAGNAHIVGMPEASTLRPLIALSAKRDESAAKTRGESADAACTAVLRITLGPRDDWFNADALEALCRQRWIATEQSNRIGVRLAVPSDDNACQTRALERSRDGELASEGVVAGSLQVPPSGLPVLFLADHPVTGGYPVIAVVLAEDLSVAAQLAPGTGVRFVVVDADTLEPVVGEAGYNDAAVALARDLAANPRRGHQQ